MNKELEAAVERARVPSMRHDEDNKWFCDMPALLRALADEPEVIASMKMVIERPWITDFEVRRIINYLAEIVR
jgi:hypothetical protein